MKRLLLLLLPMAALAQSVPNGGTITSGQVWTPAQWMSAWQSKTDYPMTSIAANSVLGSIAGGTPTALSDPLLAGVQFKSLTISGVPSAANSFIWTNTTISGNAQPEVSGPPRSCAACLIFTDTVNMPNIGVGSTGLFTPFFVYDSLNTGWEGFRSTINEYTSINAAPQSDPNFLKLNTFTGTGTNGSYGHISVTGGSGTGAFVQVTVSGGNVTNVINTIPGNNYAAGDVLSFTITGGSGTATVQYAAVNTNINDLNVLTNVSSAMNGRPGSHSLGGGSIFGLNQNIFTNNSTPQNLQIYNADECDVQLAAGSSAGEKHCMTFVTRAADAAQGIYDDSAIAFSTGNYPTSVWHYGIAFSEYSHDAPFNYTSTLIGGDRRYSSGNYSGQALYGLDLQKWDIQPGATITSASYAGGSCTVNFAATTAPLIGSTVYVNLVKPAGYNTGPGGAVLTGSSTTSAVYPCQAVGAYTSGGFIGSPSNEGIPVTFGAPVKFNGFTVDPLGNTYVNSVNANAGAVNASTGTVAAVTPVTFGGYTGGSYITNASHPTQTFPNIAIAPPPAGGTQASASVTHMALVSALNMVGGVGCTAGTLTASGGNAGAHGVMTITVSGGVPQTIAVTTPGDYTDTTHLDNAFVAGTASCTVYPEIWLGFNVTQVSIVAGAGYPCSPAPFTYASNQTQDENTPAKYAAQMACAPAPVIFNGANVSAPQWSTAGIIVGAAGTQTLQDTTSTTGGGTVTTETAWGLPVYNFDCLAACTITNVDEMWVPAPTITGQITNTNLWSVHTGGGIKANGTINAGAGSSVNGGIVNLNASSNFVVNVATGTTTSAVHIADGTGNANVNIGNGTGRVVVGGPLVTTNNNTSQYTIAGTGGCSAPVINFGGVQAGDFTCSSTAAATATITMKALAANGAYACWARNITTAANLVVQTGAKSTSTVTLTFTTGTNADIIQFGCLGYQ